MSKTAAFLSLGCKVNSYETSGLEEMFKNDGYEIVPFGKKADVYVINTCTVTQMADHKSRQMLHRARKNNPGAVVAAVGCYAACKKEKPDKGLADIYIGNQNKGEVLSLVNKELKRRENESRKTMKIQKTGGAVVKTEDTEELKIGKKAEGTNEIKTGRNSGDTEKQLRESYKRGRKDFEELPIRDCHKKTRVFLKIQDGCGQFCSYCIIPYARGPVRSRLSKNIEEEVKCLADKGYKEFVLTGIHLTSYGADLNGGEKKDLCDILELIDKIPGVERIRLGSLEPAYITKENTDRMKEVAHLCPHFHLSLQSGSESILKMMNRRYTPEIFMEGVNLLREAFFNPSITTDLIVGFPGEHEKEFEESYNFAKKVEFSSMHVFKYSKREGTPAAGFSGQVPEEVKNKRSSIMLSLGEEMRKKYQRGLFGKEQKVLFEEKVQIDSRTYWTGHSESYQKIFVPVEDFYGINLNGSISDLDKTAFNNEILKVIPEFILEDGIVGRLL